MTNDGYVRASTWPRNMHRRLLIDDHEADYSWAEDFSTCRELLESEMECNSESLADIVSSTITDEELDERFYNSFGETNGPPFTVWTKNRVYFAHYYDGCFNVESVPRNPCDESVRIGG